jgi:hypothetical protein
MCRLRMAYQVRRDGRTRVLPTCAGSAGRYYAEQVCTLRKCCGGSADDDAGSPVCRPRWYCEMGSAARRAGSSELDDVEQVYAARVLRALV